MRPARIAGLALLLPLILGACGSTTPLLHGSSAAGGESDPSQSATTGLTSQLAEFEGRLRDATAREGALVRAIASASAGARAQMRLAVAQMNRWVEDERAWLAAHPVEPCYETAGKTFETAVDAISTSAFWFAAIANASPAPSDDPSIQSAGTKAGQSLQDAARALLDAAAQAKVARTTCR
jgi:hypothetical protein